MRLPALLVTLALLAGCAEPGTDALDVDAAPTQASDEGAATGATSSVPPAPSDDGPDNATALALGEFQGTIEAQAGAGGPMGYQSTDTGVRNEVSFEEVPTEVVLELVWDDGAATRSPLLLRVIDAQERTFFASGADGTPEDPVRLVIDDPVGGTWSVEALPDDALVADQSYTLRVSAFFGGPAPEDYSAFA